MFVASKHNVYGEMCDYMTFFKVRDVTNLLDALNDVCFGQCRIQAKVARFDKFSSKEGRRVNEEKGVMSFEGRFLGMREKK